jgi:hypothetical protein
VGPPGPCRRRAPVAAGEQASDTGADGGEDVRHVVVARLGRGVKGKRPWPSFAEDAVEHERVEVDIQLEAAVCSIDFEHCGIATRAPVSASWRWAASGSRRTSWRACRGETT